jgi:hypothetical protein
VNNVPAFAYERAGGAKAGVLLVEDEESIADFVAEVEADAGNLLVAATKLAAPISC